MVNSGAGEHGYGRLITVVAVRWCPGCKTVSAARGSHAMALLRKPDIVAPLTIARDEHTAGYRQARFGRPGRRWVRCRICSQVPRILIPEIHDPRH